MSNGNAEKMERNSAFVFDVCNGLASLEKESNMGLPKLFLAPRPTEVGAETRLLMAECKGPSFPGYTLSSATECMQLMDLVLWNRLNNNPAQFMAKGATTIIDIIKAPGQFAGFANYPNYSGGIAANLQRILDIANNDSDRRQGDFRDFVNAAIGVAGDPTIPDTSPGTVAAWRTQGASSPGSRFTKFRTVGGNDFYFL
jgi:hypothetical protein